MSSHALGASSGGALSAITALRSQQNQKQKEQQQQHGVPQHHHTDANNNSTGPTAPRRLKTALDVIQYFKETANPILRFVYCTRDPDEEDLGAGGAFQPYRLLVVRPGEQPDEHWVVSPTALVHVRPGLPSHVFSAQDWLREALLFENITRIPFFRTYLKRKTLQRWILNVSKLRYTRSRVMLGKRLFPSKHTFSLATHVLHQLAFDMQLEAPCDKSLFFYPETRPALGFSIDGFYDVERAGLKAACGYLTTVLDSAAEQLTLVAQQVVKDAQIEDVSTMDALDAYIGQNSEVLEGIGPLYRTELERERQERKRQLKRVLVEYDFLLPYVRTVFNVFLSCMYKNVMTSMKRLVKHLGLPRRGGMKELRLQFQVRCIYYTDKDMQFEPSEAQLTKSVTDFCLEVVAEASALFAGRFLENSVFNTHFDAAPARVLSLKEIILADNDFVKSLQDIKDVLHKDFATARDRSTAYDQCQDWEIFVHIDWPKEFEVWKVRMNEKDKEKALVETDFRERIEQVTKGLGDLRRMSSSTSGCLYIYVEPLAQELIGRIESVLGDIKNTLLTVASRRVNDLHKELEQGMQAMSQPSAAPSVKEFCEWVERCNQQRDMERGLMQEAQEVDALYNIADENAFEVHPNHKERKERTLGGPKFIDAPLRQRFTDRLSECAQVKQDSMITIREQLMILIDQTKKSLIDLTKELGQKEFRDATASTKTVMPLLNGAAKNLQALKTNTVNYDHYCDLLEYPHPNWQALANAQEALAARTELWETLQQWEMKRDALRMTPLSKLPEDKPKDDIMDTFQKAYKLHRDDPDDVTKKLLDDVSEYKRNLPVIQELVSDALKEEHWQKILSAMTINLAPNERTFAALSMHGVYEKLELIQAISVVAMGERTLTISLDKVENGWKKTDFVLSAHKDQAGLNILGGLDEILMQLDDNQVAVQTCMASRYIEGVRTRAEEWEKKLALTRDVLDQWVNLQKNWMYLEFIFRSDDIKKQLPKETQLFLIVDGFFKKLMAEATSTMNVLEVCTAEGEDRLLMLQDMNQKLDVVQKCLEEYLETKRSAFPRFYFLSNDELLAILSDVRNAKAVNPHLQKCFDNMKELEFDGETIITAMMSSEGERVPFSEKIKVSGNVEHWLNFIEKGMRRTLYDITGKCVAAYKEMPRTKWFFEFPAQCVGCVDQIYWTAELEEVWKQIGEGKETALVEYHTSYKTQLLDTVELVKTNLTKLQRTCVCTLIVVDVHARDVVESLINEKCTKTTDFPWLRQLRYYWCETSEGIIDCNIHHSSAHVLYGYEYLGNVPRLVITPLTERAFLTCTGALHINQGAAPQGPAGTGKTESVKDLGKALARQVVVFNCSDGLNYKMMSQMFAGLAQAGAWACFDEFNRIEIEVLSVVAQQMLEITMGISRGLDKMNFDGHAIRLNKNFGVFITMNPGYAGRTELPDNLKALFRPICMMIPDYALIAEIMFFSEGFTNAKSLAQKMVKLYSLASQQLSKQDHYDFGMRAVKSILVMAGSLKRAEPQNNEDMLLIRAMRDANVPKFLKDDTVLFNALVNDLFPKVEIVESINHDLVNAVKASLKKDGLQLVDDYIEKVMQLFETMVVRHGVMLVGQTMSGKSVNARTLMQALTQLKVDGVVPAHDSQKRFFSTTRQYALNPKSISMGEMYGDINPMTREWCDGILSAIVRDLVRETGDDRNWIVFDGPVDAIWIENMNTVLDDNKLLCLVNGERIKLPDTMSIMFEVQDLRVASPATVSRCGMVYMEAEYLDGGWRPLCRTFSERITADGGLGNKWRHDRAMDLLERVLPRSLEFYRKQAGEYIITVDGQLATCLLQLLVGLLKTSNEETSNNNNTENGGEGQGEAQEPKGELVEIERPKPPMLSPVPTDDSRLFDMYFAMAFIWSVGANIKDKFRKAFSDIARKILDPLNVGLPSPGLVYDYCIHAESMSWMLWEYRVPAFRFVRSAPYFEHVVATADTECLTYIMRTLVHVQKNLLVNGVTGTGKSCSISAFLADVMKTEDAKSDYTSFSVTFSAQTSSTNFQETMESKLHKRRGDKVLGPAPGKKMIMVVDDCNMPQLEKYGASPPIELLRQIQGFGGCYDRKKRFWKEFQDVITIACCGDPGGGKNVLTGRLTSQFHCICIPSLSSTSMKTIFLNILTGFLAVFAPAVKQMAKDVVAATIEVYERIAAERLPTPQKTHYTFNLRDISKVFQGILQLEPANMSTLQDLVKVWVHEGSRVFHDRLVTEDDKHWWWECVFATAKKYFKQDCPETYRTTLYGSWMDKTEAYKESTDPVQLQNRLTEYQADYNMVEQKDVDLVLFDDAVAHLARICRVLRQPRGNALLVGVGGSGRSSLCRLGAHICNMSCRSIAIARNYGVSEFREDIKKFLLECGGQGKPVVFLMSDTQIVTEQFVEDINNILNTGEVPGIMQEEDMGKIMTGVRDRVRAAGKQDTRGVMYQFFVQECRNNLHVMMCMSPIGDQFRNRLRMFPSLVNCMTIDWYTKWPEPALLQVAQRQLGKADFISSSKEVRQAVCQACVIMHCSVEIESEDMFSTLRRRNYTTPTSYLSLLSSYLEMLKEQNTQTTQMISRYQGGLDTLESAHVVIEDLKVKIREMQPVIAKAADDAEKQNQELIVKQEAADKVKAEVTEEEKISRDKMAEVSGIKKECQEVLNQAIPALKDAERAIDTLSKKDIDEIKAFSRPPAMVELTLNAVMVMLKAGEGWDAARKLLSDLGFLKNLQAFDRDDIAPATIRKLQKYVQDEAFVPVNVEKTSLACRSLCMWVHAIHKYYHVSREVAPKKERLAAAESQLNIAAADLKQKQDKLAEVIAGINRLRKMAEETQQRKDKLEKQKVDAEIKLTRADQLIGGLASEKVRWESQVVILQKSQKKLVGTMLLAAGSVAYLGPFTAAYRAKLIALWVERCQELNIPVDDAFSLGNITDPVVVREWGVHGLPDDAYSVENGTILQRSKRWCLMIDPQGQANAFIKNMEKANKLKVIKLTEEKYMQVLEASIRNGVPVLLENVGESLDAALNPLLSKDLVRQGARLLLRLGDNDVDYDPRFKFYVTTKLPNPLYPPELQIKVSIVNCTVTRAGLEDQLLADVVKHERSDLAKLSDETIVAIAEGKRKIKDLEDMILKMLSEAGGDILDNVELIDTLSSSKKTSEEVSADLEKSEKTSEEISEARERYRSIATRGSLIYGVIAEIANVDPMYQNSLQYYKKLFTQTLSRTAPQENVSDRISSLIPAITWASYSIVCRGLFERDKPLYSFLLVLHIFRHSHDIAEEEWSYFLRASGGQSIPGPETPSFLTELQWNDLKALSQVTTIPRGVLSDIAMNGEEWKTWLVAENSYELPMPGAICSKLSIWHTFLVIRALRPEKVALALAAVVTHYLGKEYMVPPPFNLSLVYEDSTKMTPIIFVLSAGTDPTIIFTTFAQDMGFVEKNRMLSLGQDQGTTAERFITEGKKDGLWVYLQNCHVYTSWMNQLEKLVDYQPNDVHEDFRLWLTSMPSASFPVAVLQAGLKLTREPPKGLRANLKDSFRSLDADVWAENDEDEHKAIKWKKLVLSLAFFHGLIQERRKFGALGWNIRYDFSAPDMAASIKAIRIAVNSGEDIAWSSLRYTVGVLNYGGRVTDFLDVRCLMSFVNSIFTERIFDEDFEFSGGGGGVYSLPPATTLEEVDAFVDNLPPWEQPELFGLNANANVTFQQQESSKFIATLLDIQPRGGAASGGKSTDDIVFDIATDLLERIPSPVDKSRSHPEVFRILDSGTMISLGTVLSQEIDQFNTLLAIIKNSLQELKSAIKGEVVMSVVIETMYGCFVFNQVPPKWKEKGYLCLKPLASYFRDLIERINFISKWCYEGMPKSFWLSGLFFPQGFLTGVYQTHSRRFTIPIDSVKMRFSVLNDVLDPNETGALKERPDTGVYVHGFFMEGARWAKTGIAESHPGALFDRLPVMHFQPVKIGSEEDVSIAGKYECPLYKASTRAGELSTTGLSTNFVISLFVDSGEREPDHWVKRGVAALCMLDT